MGKWGLNYRILKSSRNSNKIIDNKWSSITEKTQLYGGEIVRQFKNDKQYIYKLTGAPTLPGLIELFEIDKLGENGEIFIAGAPNAYSLNPNRLIKENFEILDDGLSKEQEWPRTLNESIYKLEDLIGKEEINKLKVMDKNAFDIKYVFFGQYIRNQFGLWRGNKSLILDVSKTTSNPDDISEIIIEEFLKYIKSKY